MMILVSKNKQPRLELQKIQYAWTPYRIKRMIKGGMKNKTSKECQSYDKDLIITQKSTHLTSGCFFHS